MAINNEEAKSGYGDISPEVREHHPNEIGNRRKYCSSNYYLLAVIILPVLVALLYYQLYAPIQQLNENIQQLNTSINMLNQQLSQQNDSVYQELNEKVQQLNTSINMLSQQLSQQNDSVYQQLNEKVQQLNKKIQQLNKKIQQLNKKVQQLNISINQKRRRQNRQLNKKVQQLNISHNMLSQQLGSLSCGAATAGWIRVAELDMTNSSHQCPSDLMERTDSGKRTCVRNETEHGCSSISNYIAPGVQYSNVCGRVIGYQYGLTEAFHGNSENLNSAYVDGVSLTHGDPRQHIWTFAAARDELGTYSYSNCPCTNTDLSARATPPPAFVGNDYFCDTGSEKFKDDTFYGDDPLWDGAGCGPLNRCCSFNAPPWFYKHLPQPTTDDIEMRLCTISTGMEVAIEIVEIYIY